MRKLIIIFICILNFSGTILCQQQYKMYGGDNCTFDYLVYSPSGKTSNSNPKLVQLCDYQENLKEGSNQIL